jgi:hypothetical protein
MAMSGTTYGVNSQTYHHLPPEDQASIRDAYLARQEPANDTPASTTPTETAAPPPADPATAQTPQAAVAAIHGMTVPTTSDLPPGMPSYAQQAVYEERAGVFNQSRVDAAQAALDRFAPQRSDYDGLNGATASYEYQQAQQAYNSDPYVAELRRIVDEAQTQPNDIPAYLTGADSTTDVQQFAPEQMRSALSLLGVDLPENPTPEQMAAGYDILGTVPDDILATLINPGSQVSYTSAGGVGTPNLFGPSVQYGVQVQGKVELGDVQTGVNFEQTQQFEMSVQVQGGTVFDLSKTPLQRMYKWADRLGQLPDAARDMVNGSPILRQVVKGLPVSGSYTEFEGARLSYEAVVTPGQGTQIANGDLAGVPNPLDPLSMPQGTSLLMRGQSLTGSTFEANWKAFTVGGTHTELSGLGFGVTRGEGSIVEVYSGPVDTVENSAFFGLGRQGALALGVGSDLSMETREMQIARIDLSTSEGQAAYQTFISTGRVPDWSPPGVKQSGTTEVFSHEYASFIGLQVGGLTLGGSNDANGTITRTTWADGTVDYSNTYTSTGGVTTDVRYQLDDAGNPDYSNATWTVVRANLDPTLANYLESAYDPSRSNQFPDNAQHTQQTFTTDELMALRDRARDYVVEMQGQEKLDNLDSDVETPWWSSQEEALAIADTPEEVFAVLGNDFHGGAVIQSLLGMTVDGNTLPGQFRMIDAG